MHWQCIWADLATTLLWKVTAAPWTNEALEPKAEAVDPSNLCLMLEMSKDNCDSNTNSTNFTWFLLCNNNNNTVAVTSPELSLVVRCPLTAAVEDKPVFLFVILIVLPPSFIFGNYIKPAVMSRHSWTLEPGEQAHKTELLRGSTHLASTKWPVRGHRRAVDPI